MTDPLVNAWLDARLLQLGGDRSRPSLLVRRLDAFIKAPVVTPAVLEWLQEIRRLLAGMKDE